MISDDTLMGMFKMYGLFLFAFVINRGIGGTTMAVMFGIWICTVTYKVTVDELAKRKSGQKRQTAEERFVTGLYKK